MHRLERKAHAGALSALGRLLAAAARATARAVLGVAVDAVVDDGDSPGFGESVGRLMRLEKGAVVGH